MKNENEFVELKERKKYPHIKFGIDRSKDLPSSYLEIDGHRIRFLNVEVKSRPGEMPLVTIQIYARMLEGEIKGGDTKLQIIHTDESTKGLIGSGKPPDGCPAT